MTDAAPPSVLSKIIRRLGRGPEGVRLVVIGYDVKTYRIPDACARVMSRAARLGLAMKRVTADDDAALDEITAIDEWRIGKEWSLTLLSEGWRCYVATMKGRIVAATWAIVGGRFRDDVLGREFVLADDEAYYYRAYTVRGFRGRGVMPALAWFAMDDVAKQHGATHGLLVTRSTNRAMQRTLYEMGGTRLGTLGFVGLFGIRLHYLLGARAFSRTARRTYLDLGLGARR